MAKPRKSTFDAWLDTFASWSAEDQAGALKACEMVCRIAPAIRRGMKELPESKATQPKPITHGGG